MPKDNPTHPGETIQEILYDSDMTAAELAEALNIGLDNLIRLMHGQTALTPQTAVALERIGWSNTTFWLRWQAGNDQAKIRREPATESDPKDSGPRAVPAFG